MKVKSREGEHSPILLRALSLSNDRYRNELDEYLNAQGEPFDVQISVTTLNKAPRETQLIKRHYDDIEIDPMDNYYTMFGSGIHNILEQAVVDGEEVEIRRGIVVDIGGVKVLIHGQADYYKGAEGRLEDHKYTSAWTVTKSKADHIAQLNVLGYIWREHGLPVEELYNNYLFRDWSAQHANVENYPKEQALWQSVPLWPDAECLKYIIERATKHVQSTEASDKGLPLCTPEERWSSGGGVRLHYRTKAGDWAKRPLWCRSKAELEEKRAKYIGVETKEEKVVAEPKKCLKYCLGAKFCNQFKKYLAKVNQTK